MAAKKQTELVEDIPQHILDSPHLSGVQKKAFARVKRAAAKDEKEAEKPKKVEKK